MNTVTQDHFPSVKEFDFERDFPYFKQLEVKRFDQPMDKNQTIYLLKRYSSRYWFVADINGNGILDTYIISGQEKNKSLHIFSIAVREEFEGKGWGRYLMDFLVNKAKSDDIRLITLEVQQENTRAIKFYKKYGFIHKYMKYNYYGEDRHAIVMELDLNKFKNQN